MQMMTAMIDDVLNRMCPENLKSHPTVAQAESSEGSQPEETLTKIPSPLVQAREFNSGSAETEGSAGDCAERVAQAVKHLKRGRRVRALSAVRGLRSLRLHRAP